MFKSQCQFFINTGY